MTLTLAIIEQRAKALGWPTSPTQNPFDGGCLRVVTPSGYVVFGLDADGEGSIFDRESDISPCRHDLSALESPEPVRPGVDPVTGLMPCPFCGGRATALGGRDQSIECDNCEARTYGGDADEARAAWNRRTP